MGIFNLLLTLGSGLLLFRTINAQSSAYDANTPRWEWEPPYGPLANGDQGQYLNLSSGVSLWYTSFGNSNPNHTSVLLLHGGKGNSNQMFNQANYLAQTRRVILQDIRGEGRSPYANFTDFHYDDFTRDAIALLDHLNVPKVAVVGWSDGAITGLDLAMNYSSRIDRVFAHGANIQADQNRPGKDDPIISSNNGTFNADNSTGGVTYAAGSNFTKRDAADTYSCQTLSPIPSQCDAMTQAVQTMWVSEPYWEPSALATIKCPVWSVDGDHDVEVERNQADAIAAWTPYAGQLILPQVGHFALLEDPKFFNFAVEYFLDLNYDGVLPYY